MDTGLDAFPLAICPRSLPTRALTDGCWCALIACMSGKKHEPGKKVKVWQASPTPNLTKHVPSGYYYLKGRFGGEPVRESLKTKDYATAKLRLPVRMDALRATHGKPVGKMETLGDALAALMAKIKVDPSIMPNTRISYTWELKSLGAGKGAALPANPLALLTDADMMEWWGRVAKDYAPQQANHLLRWVRECIEIARTAGKLRRDISKDLKRVKMFRVKRALLAPAQLANLVEYLRARRAHELADWLEFAAYSGMRPGEMMGLCWEHIGKDRIEVTTGKTMSIMGRSRFVPIIAPMVDLLARLRASREAIGRVFLRVQRPRCDGLRQACAKLGLPPQRVYDLRHLFATMAIKSGVDVPTVSRWLGHNDGGALAMKTYVHPDDQHSMEAAKKVTF